MFTVATVTAQSATTCSGLANCVRWRPTMGTTGSLIVEPRECHAACAGPSFHTMDAPPLSSRSIVSTRARAAASVPHSQCGGALACAAAVTSFASAASRASSMPEAPARSIDRRSRETCCTSWCKSMRNKTDRTLQCRPQCVASSCDNGSVRRVLCSSRAFNAPTLDVCTRSGEEFFYEDGVEPL